MNLNLFVFVVLIAVSLAEELPCMIEGNCRGLVIVDVQNDFVLPKGKLSAFSEAVPPVDGESVVYDRGDVASSSFESKISEFISLNKDKYDFIVYSIDYHPGGKPGKDELHRQGTAGEDYHCSFDFDEFLAGLPPTDNTKADQEAWKTRGTVKTCDARTVEAQRAWPPHCMQGDDGAKLSKCIPVVKDPKSISIVVTHNKRDDKDKALSQLTQLQGESTENMNIKEFTSNVFSDPANIIEIEGDKKLDVIYVFKGMNPKVDSYSAFKENSGDWTKLDATIKSLGYHTPSQITLDVFGIAYDYCVKFTALDAQEKGYKVNFMEDLTYPIADVKDTNKQLQGKVNIELSSKVFGDKAKASRRRLRKEIFGY